MRGTFINKEVNLLLETDGEEWSQGDTIKGTITINKSSGSVKLILAYGIIKKVRTKDSKAWTILDEIECSSLTENRWEFNLPTTTVVSDKSGSLFLLYGEGDTLENYGTLQLKVNVHNVIKEYLSVFETYLKFQVKQIKGDKSFTKVKLSPPISNSYKSIDSLECKINFKDEVLDIKYIFKLKKLNTNVVGEMEVINEKKELKQRLTSKDYHCFGSSTNFDGIQTKIEEIVKEANPKFFS